MAPPSRSVAAVGAGVVVVAGAVVTDRAELTRLTALAHDRTNHLPTTTRLRQLYDQAVTAAQTDIGGDLGDAIAGVLAMEAERLRIIQWNSILGQSKVMMSLAVAVMRARQERAV